MPVTTMLAIRNGNAPLKIVPMGTSLATAFTVKILSPIGGVMAPICISMHTNMPNQIISTPEAIRNGWYKGRVKTIMLTESITIPRGMYEQKNEQDDDGWRLEVTEDLGQTIG